MDSVTLREASEDLPALVDRVQQGEDVVITRDGVPVARLVHEPPLKPAGRRVLTPRQEEALRRSMAILELGFPVNVGNFDRDEIYAERLARQYKP